MEPQTGKLAIVLGSPRPPDESPTCGGCRRKAAAIPEVVETVAEDLGVENPSASMIQNWIVLNEGTFNPETKRFLCDGCYVRAGMPSNPFPEKNWICP